MKTGESQEAVGAIPHMRVSMLWLSCSLSRVLFLLTAGIASHVVASPPSDADIERPFERLQKKL